MIVSFVCLFVIRCSCVVTCSACGVSLLSVLVVWRCVCCASCLLCAFVVRVFLLCSVVVVVHGRCKCFCCLMACLLRLLRLCLMRVLCVVVLFDAVFVVLFN